MFFFGGGIQKDLTKFSPCEVKKTSRFTSFAEAKNRQSYVSQQAALKGLEVRFLPVKIKRAEKKRQSF